ncbi:ATP-grasp domain-containing protein [Candidatus Gracilibacteria bacterium]|nr:ATP-grasp domain-containing protein [Candidatus Gracilibacteria bacterium]
MNIAILTGGISTERAIALKSASNMNNWITSSGYTSKIFDLPENIDLFLETYQDFDLVIPMFHGRYGEDGIISGMCESLGIRVAFSPSHVHALCINKYWTNSIVEKIGVKVPKSWIPGLPHPAKLLPNNESKELEITLIIKPNQGGSSLATTRATTLEEFKLGIEAVDSVIVSLTQERIQLLESASKSSFIRKFPTLTDVAIVQECIPGREFTVGVYKDTTGTHVLPIIEIVTIKQDFFDYEEKYESDGSNEVFSDIESALENELISTSTRIYDFLGCRGVVRIDYRYDSKNIYFLEVNTIPGFTSGSLVPKMWKKTGKTEKEFIEMLNLTS